MTDEPVGAWPVSGAATAILLGPKRTYEADVLRLALKELVVRRVWVLDVQRGGGLFGRKVVRTLLPGTRPVPPLATLMTLDRGLRLHAPAGGELGEVLRTSLKRDATMREAVHDAARAELLARGLIELRRERALGLFPHTKLVVTPAGESWAQAARGRMAGIGAAGAAGIAALGGLVLLLDPAPLMELDATLARLRSDSSGGTTTGGGEYTDGGTTDLDLSGLDLDLDLGDLSALDDLDGGFDSAVDSGSGGDGGGGDGGGGGD